MTRVIMHGCNGHMGQVITKLAEEDTDVEIVAGVDPFDDGHNSYPVFSSIEKCDVDADVVIDFSSAKAEDALIDYCTASKLPVIVCTTGLSEAQLTKIREASEKVAVLKSANMSLGINTLFKLLQDAARVFCDAGFDVELVEKHHNKKLDAPSGTALALADSIKEVLGSDYFYKFDRSGERHKEIRRKSESALSVAVRLSENMKSSLQERTRSLNLSIPLIQSLSLQRALSKLPSSLPENRQATMT